MSLLFGDSREFCDFYEVRIVKIDRDKCIQYPETSCTYKGMLRLCSTCQRWFVCFLLDGHGSYGDDSSSGCAYELNRNISHKSIYIYSLHGLCVVSTAMTRQRFGMTTVRTFENFCT